MSDASSSAESRRLRVARALGVVMLLVLQGGCGIVLGGLLRLQRDTEAARPTRAANRAALERMGTAAVMFPAAGGTIDSFGDDLVVVMSVSGQRVRVRIDPETLFLRSDGPAKPSDMYPGADVVVSGLPGADGDVLADAILIAKP
jgi:hypothetical protein